LEHTVLEQLA